MNFSEEILDQIDRYLGRELTSDEVLDFERKMAKDPQLKDLVDLQREVVSGIKKTAHLDLKKRLNSLHEQMPVSNNKPKVASRKLSRLRVLAIAASLAFLVIVGWIIFKGENKSEELFAAPNKRPVLIEKYIVKPANSETIDVLVYDWKKNEWKYNFQNQRFTLMIEEGITLKKENLDFFRNNKNELYLRFKSDSIQIKTSDKLQSIENGRFE